MKFNQLLFILCFASAIQAQRNVVLIIADDLGTDYLGFYEDHQDTAAMPNIRALLQKGVRFTKAIANPICSPTRAGMLTGRYSFRTGVGTAVGGVSGGPSLNMTEKTLPQLLETFQPNIAKANIGKWHLHNSQAANLMNPNLLGYDHYSGLFIGALPDYSNWSKITNGVTSNVTTYATTETTNEAITWTSNQTNPFFLWLAYNAPHSPYHLPPAGLHSYTNLSGTTQDIAQNPKPYFKASLEALDHEIGRLFVSLKAQGKYDNTDFIFIGDNGNTQQTAQIANTARAKGTIYEYGVHVPMIISGPSVVNPGRVSNALVHTTDLFSTILDLFGYANWASQIAADKPVDSKSMLPVLKNECEDVRPWVFTEIFKPTTDASDGKAIRSKDFKLLKFDDGHQEFYNLTTDPNELTNLLLGTLTATQQANFNYLSNELKKLTGGTTKPQISAWLRNLTGIKGRHYVNGNSTPIQDNVLANIQSVKYSANWVYVEATGIPSYITGPFLDNNPTLATAQTGFFKFPLVPVQNTGTPTATSGGNIGAFINGVALFDYRDGVAWNTTTNALCGGPGNPQCPGGMGAAQSWNRDAILAERGGFDCAKGHPANGNYHHHQNPSAFNLDLTVISNVCNIYLADGLYSIDSTKHSPLIGFAYDGFPIYGAYGYKNTDGTGGITRIKSGYKLRSITVRTHHADGTDVADGPPISTTYSLGYFREDYAFTAGVNEVLDVHNGRFCVTPDYPQGTYAYFATVNANWNSAYPYAVGPTFYGTRTASKVTSITETVTTYTSEPLAAATTACQIDCGGNATGAINLFVNGGNTPYSFNWGGGITTQNRSGIGAGTYTVTITDATGLTNIQTATILQPAMGIVASATATNVACNGNASGAIQLNITGSTVGYTFLWNDGQTTQNRTNLAAGNYSVTITNGSGCSSVVSKTITQPTAIAINGTATTATCGANNGAISLTINGGTTPFSFVWNNGLTVQNPTNLAAANYSVIATDANGCTAQFSTVVNTLGAPTASAIATTVNCFGQATGSIQLNVNSGTAPFSFLWNNGLTVQNPNGLVAGNYAATITDVNNCTATVATNIAQSNEITVAANASNASCGQSNGSIALTVNGGLSPYSYNWNTGSLVKNQSNLAAGTYSVTITDANNCTKISTASISNTNAATANLTATPVTCFGNANGSLTLQIVGGISPFSFQWNDGSTQQNRTNLAAGNYTVTILDGNGCATVVAKTVEQPNAIAINGTTTTSTCGANNGAILLTINGGTAPFSFVWNNGLMVQNPTNLAGANYSVIATDANGCTAQFSTVVNTLGAPTASIVATAVKCFGEATGSIQLNVNSGTAPFSYVWSNGLTVQNPTGLVAGNYSATISDANSCTTTVTTIITQSNAITGSTSASNASCGANNGAISLTINGGNAPYSYIWSNGSTVQNPSNLAAANYSVIATDANGCSAQFSTVVNTFGAPTASTVATAVKCFGEATGSIQLNVTNGTAPFSFLWNNGFTVQNPSGLAAGIYAATITDANGCTTTATSNITQNSAIAVSASASNATCGQSNGSISLTVNGGVAPYNYAWNTGVSTQNLTNLAAGAFLYTITDALGCAKNGTATVSNLNAAVANLTASQVTCFGGTNGSLSLNISGGTSPFTYQWNDGSTQQNRTNLAAGTYNVTILDGNGCVTVLSKTIEQPNAITINGQATSSLCGANNGSIALNVNGGTAPFSFVWSNGATEQNPTNLSAANYTVTATDANGCAQQFSTIVTGTSAPVAAAVATAVKCFGEATGSINLNISGGTAPFSFVWNNGATTQNLSNLVAGNYNATITDANACTSTVSQTVSQPIIALIVNAAAQNIGCFGENTGGINLSVSGGTATYTFLWNNGATTQNLTNLPTGVYASTITDANGCTSTISEMLTQPSSALAVTTNAIAATIANDGTAEAIPLGGTPPYSYLWSNGFTGNQQINLAAGTYFVSVIDANACITTANAIVELITATPLVFGEIGLNIFPNPTSDMLIVQANGLLRRSLQLELVAENGQILLKNELPQGSTICVFDTQTLYEGCYLLNISDGVSMKKFKVVVSR
jgi:arylsulfatase A-like enzyme